MLFEPDNFKNNWYGWITNQWAHTLLGQLLFGIIMVISMYFGEFASRSYVWSGIAIAYIAWEVATHRVGKWWDAIEDFIFVCVYGAGWVSVVFHEVDIGSSSFFGDAFAIVPIICLFAFHSTLGVLLRLDRKADN